MHTKRKSPVGGGPRDSIHQPVSVDAAMPFLPTSEREGLPSDWIGGYDASREMQEEYGE